jgi:hypothetical protein
MNAAVMATEDRVPVEWVAERILGVGRTRAFELLSEIAKYPAPGDWFRQKVLDAMVRRRIGRGRQTRRSALADAFFIALAGGEVEARICAVTLIRRSHDEWNAAKSTDREIIDREVCDYLVQSRLLWRLAKKD